MSSLVDLFDRANAPTLGPTWTAAAAGYHLTSGAAQADGTFTSVAQLKTELATGDHEAEIEVGNAYGGSFTGVAFRMPALGSDGASTGAYYLLLLSGSTGTSFSLRRKEPNATTVTPLASGTSSVDGRLDGSVWRGRSVTDPANSTRVLLSGYVNDALVVSAVDTSGLVPATQRRVGIYTGGATGPDMRFARIAAADVVAAPADTLAPTVPGSVAAAATSASSVQVAWSASTDAVSVASYRVRRDGTDLAAAVTGTSFTDTGVPAGTHTYTVSAVDAAGNRSAESTPVTVTLAAPDTSPPPVPAGLTATAGTSQVVLQWGAVAAGDLAGYRLYRWTAAAPTHVLIASPAAASFTDTGVTAGTAYSYAVRSVDQAGNASAESAAATATPTARVSGTGPTFGIWNGAQAVPVTLLGIWNGTGITPVSSVTNTP